MLGASGMGQIDPATDQHSLENLGSASDLLVEILHRVIFSLDLVGRFDLDPHGEVIVAGAQQAITGKIANQSVIGAACARLVVEKLDELARRILRFA
ncbi:hypothetical protein MTX20_25985 [Bradyrhizobium sp. ISRA435]|nr:hypothetical protein MTX20_25985 [Bradyrhizobium sp. ISRA435]